jgi:hypothetical protein
MHAVARPLELRLLLPLAILVPLGFAVTHIAQTGTLDPGRWGSRSATWASCSAPMSHCGCSANQGDQLLLPCVATIGAIGIVMLNRLPQDLRGSNFLGVEFGHGVDPAALVRGGPHRHGAGGRRFRDDGVLRHYKYTWALAGTCCW